MKFLFVLVIKVVVVSATLSTTTEAAAEHPISTRGLQTNSLRIPSSVSSCMFPLEVHSQTGGHAVDGSSLDWRTSPNGETQPLDESNTYFLANLFDSDNAGKGIVLARAYGNFDCEHRRLFIAIHVDGKNATEIETSLIRGVALNDARSVPVGWEVSYSFAQYQYPNEFCLPGFTFQAIVIPGRKTVSTGALALKYTCLTQPLLPSPLKPTFAPVSDNVTQSTPLPGSKSAPSSSPSYPSLDPMVDDGSQPVPPTESEMICDGYCPGTFPYGCAENLDFPWKYMCEPGGGCYYSYDEDDNGPYDDNSIFCTYKTQTPTNPRDRPIYKQGGLRTSTPIPSSSNKNDCDGYCVGSFPYGCAVDLEGIVKFMCLPDGGCYYTDDEFDDGPYDDNALFCTYRDLTG